MDHDPNFHEDITSKIATLEANDAALERNISNLTSRVSEGFSALSKKIDEVSDRSRITWPVIFSCVSTIVGVLGVCALVGTMAISPLKLGMENMSNDLKRHIDIDGHPQAMALHARYDERFLNAFGDINELRAADDLLDETLQREMRLLDDTGDARLNALDTRLQMEMRLLNETQNTEIRNLKEIITELKKASSVVGTPSDPLYPILEKLEARINKVEQVRAGF